MPVAPLIKKPGKKLLFSKIPLPSWLYYQPKSHLGAPSQAARFNPASAINSDEAWQSTTSPQEDKKCKTLVIDENIFYQGLNEQRWVAIIAYLQAEGFNLYICTQRDCQFTLSSCQEGVELIESALSSTRAFDEFNDYERLADYGISRDQSVFIIKEKRDLHR